MIYLHVTSVLPSPDFAMDPECAVRGRYVHKACDFLDRGMGLKWDKVPAEYAPYIRAWEKCKAEVGFTVIETEQQVTSEKHGYIGRLDNVIEIPKRGLYILDKKTGGIPDTVGLQTAGYQQAHLEQFPDMKPLRRAVCQLKEDGSYQFITEDTPKQMIFRPIDLRVFLSFLVTKQWEMVHGHWMPEPRE